MGYAKLEPKMIEVQFKKGVCPNPGGVAKDDVKIAFRQLCEKELPKNFDRLLELYSQKKCSTMVKFKILEFLVTCGGGLPPKDVNVNVTQTSYVEFLRQAGTAMVEAANIVEAEIIEQADEQMVLPLLVEDKKPEESI